jgi:hypothetical protein
MSPSQALALVVVWSEEQRCRVQCERMRRMTKRTRAAFSALRRFTLPTATRLLVLLPPPPLQQRVERARGRDLACSSLCSSNARGVRLSCPRLLLQQQKQLLQTLLLVALSRAHLRHPASCRLHSLPTSRVQEAGLLQGRGVEEAPCR